VLLLRISMSLSSGLPLKSPKPATVHSKPTAPSAADDVTRVMADVAPADVIALLLISQYSNAPVLLLQHVGFAGNAAEIAATAAFAGRQRLNKHHMPALRQSQQPQTST
jgi:hypothetical protein